MKIQRILKEECISSIQTYENLPFNLMYPMYNKVKEKELSHSEILRCLLTPEEAHKHNKEFLKLFFKEIGLEEHFIKSNNIEIRTEFGTKASEESNSRPIDIFISYIIDNTKYGIIVENKLNNARDQINQINDYYKGIIALDYVCSKIVYIHINPAKKIQSTDIEENLKEYCYNYDVTKLISTLEELKNYSYISEYQKLLKKISHSFMNINNALEIQEKLENEELAEIIKICEIVQSDNWNNAKHNKIIDGLSMPKLKSSFEKKYSTYYVDGYKFWAEVWYYPLETKVYVCSYKEEEIIKVKDREYKFLQKFKDRYFYENKNSMYKCVKVSDEIITTIKDIIEFSKK